MNASPSSLWSRRNLVIGALVLLLFAVMGWLGFWLFSSEALATLSGATGPAQRDTSQSIGEWVEAERGDEFYEGDGAKTIPESEAEFRLSTGARLTLRPSSQIRFHSSHQQRQIGLDVVVGEALVRTRQGLTIDSQFGPIVIDADSQVQLRRSGQNLLVEVDLGTISLGQEARSFEAGETVQLELGGLVLDLEPADDEPEQAQELDGPDLDAGDGTNESDLVVRAGESFTVHDPRPPTAVTFSVNHLCDGPARIELGKLRTEAIEAGSLRVGPGRHHYEVFCLDDPDRVAAEGNFSVIHDSGTRPLPAFVPQATVAADGRNYTVLYQHHLPTVTVTWPSAPEADAFTFVLDGRRIPIQRPRFALESLGAGTHQVSFAAATQPPRASRTTTIQVSYDAQAPKARVSEPSGEFDAGGPLTVSGQAMPGWKVSLDGQELKVDAQRRFTAKTSANSTFPIAFSHPTQGTHYYLRRPRASSP